MAFMGGCAESLGGGTEGEGLEQWYPNLPRDIQRVTDNRRKTPSKCGARVPRADP